MGVETSGRIEFGKKKEFDSNGLSDLIGTKRKRWGFRLIVDQNLEGEPKQKTITFAIHNNNNNDVKIMSESQPFSPLPLLADDKCGGNCLQRRNFKKNKMSKFSKKVKQQSLAFKIYPIVKVNFHTKFHQNWTKWKWKFVCLVGGQGGCGGWSGPIFSIGSSDNQIINIRHQKKFQLYISRRSKVI